MSFLEEVWEEREEVHYRTIFGTTSSNIYTLSPSNFRQYNCKKIDPRWLTYGVIILLSVGYFENLSIFDYGDRVPLSLSSQIKVMLFTYPLNFPHNFLLPSGTVDLIQVVGITRDEADMVKEISSKELRLKLIDSIGGLITDKERSSIME